jgi:hypothetical protein
VKNLIISIAITNIIAINTKITDVTDIGALLIPTTVVVLAYRTDVITIMKMYNQKNLSLFSTCKKRLTSTPPARVPSSSFPSSVRVYIYHLTSSPEGARLVVCFIIIGFLWIV